MQELEIPAQQMGINLSKTHLEQFELYYRLLISWNQQMNLTGITSRAEVLTKHFLDSLSCLYAVPTLPPTVIDVGTGAGFPGLVLKITQPHIHLTLVEATGKKIRFLEEVIQQLHLDHVTLLPNRAEEAGRLSAHREKYALAVARAVGELRIVAEYLLPLLQPGGIMLAQKGVDPADEVKLAANALGILGGRYQKTLPVSIPGLNAARHLVLVEKIKPTPKQYPRKAGTPAHKPI